MCHVDSGYADVCIGDVEHRIPGYQRRRVAIRPKTQMRQVKHGRRSQHIAQRGGVLFGRSIQIWQSHGHGVNLFAFDWSVSQQTLVEVRQVAVGISVGRYSLVNLKYLHCCPGNILVGQRTQHDPGSMTSTHCHRKLTSHGNCSASVGGNDGRCAFRRGLRIRQHFQCHLKISKVTCRWPDGYFFSKCPPNSNRIAESNLSAKSASPRELKRS